MVDEPIYTKSIVVTDTGLACALYAIGVQGTFCLQRAYSGDMYFIFENSKLVRDAIKKYEARELRVDAFTFFGMLYETDILAINEFSALEHVKAPVNIVQTTDPSRYLTN